MKIFLNVDLEGISGVVSEEKQSLPGSLFYQEARKFLMSDVNSAIKGAIEGGADKCVVFDSHCDGLNIIFNELNEKTDIIIGNPTIISEEYMRKFDAKILIGYHSMAETEYGNQCHTYDNEIKYIEINDNRIGEIGIEILIASFLDIPTILVTGDSKAET